MRNVCFTIWMLLFWIGVSIQEYIHFLIRGKALDISLLVFFINLFIWVLVAFLLYERKEETFNETF